MSRAAVWVRQRPDEVRVRLLDRGARPRLIVPSPNGTFVVGPVGPHAVADMRALLGGGVGLEWTDTGIRVVGDPLGTGEGTARERFTTEGLTGEAELVRLLDQGHADAAVPPGTRAWWEPWVGERRQANRNRASAIRRTAGRVRAFAPPVFLLLCPVLSFALYPRVFPGSPFGPILAVLGVVAAVLGLVNTIEVAVLFPRWSAEHPVRDPLGVLTSAEGAGPDIPRPENTEMGKH